MIAAKVYIFLNAYSLIVRERENVSERGAERERGRERIPSRLCAVSVDPDVGLSLTNHEIMT